MGQPDLSSNSLISHTDVFADIINAVVYEGEQVLEEQNLKPYYVNNSTAKGEGKLKGLYRDNCMEDLRNGIRYVIWGIENQYVDDYRTSFKVMGYDYTGYDRQIEEFASQNKREQTEAYINGILPEQKLKPIITIVLYYGINEIPSDICAMIDLPKDKAIRKYIQNYKLNMIKLRDLTKEQVNNFRSDFACIAKFLSKSYNKEERKEMLKNNKQVLIHTRDTLFTLASITKDERYLRIGETRKGEAAVCEIADALFEEGLEQGIKSMIEACKELGVKWENTFAKVVEKYHFTDKQALEYMNKYWI